MTRVCVDFSATLIHHGHINIIRHASEYGKVVVALTTDDEIKLYKGYEPELKFEHRKIILSSLSYVTEVIASAWVITDNFLIENDLDLLVHGDDNSNDIPAEKLVTIPRTIGISSSLMRKRAYFNQIVIDTSESSQSNWRQLWNQKPILAGKSSIQDLIRLNGFDSVGESLTEKSWRQYISDLKTELNLNTKDSLCEIGCGAGAFLVPFVESNFEDLTGCDYSESLIQSARKNLPGITFFNTDALSLPLSRYYHTFIFHSVLQYMPKQYASRVIRRLLSAKPERILLLDVPFEEFEQHSLDARKTSLGEDQFQSLYADYAHTYYNNDFFRKLLPDSYVIQPITSTMYNYHNSPFRRSIALIRE